MQRRKYATDGHKHPVNVIHHEEATFGERLADGIASFIGSWRFLIIQTCLVAIWVSVNTLQATGRIHIDPFPYILLNLAFSTQAAYAAPLILLGIFLVRRLQLWRRSRREGVSAKEILKELKRDL